MKRVLGGLREGKMEDGGLEQEQRRLTEVEFAGRLPAKIPKVGCEAYSLRLLTHG